MNYEESVKYLLGLGNEVFTMKLGLENITKLLSALGVPQNNYLKIQIAGTNGKGSTCAFLDAICVVADIKTGLYTSPHLVSITERIKIGGAEISETNFARHATQIKITGENLVESGELKFAPTFFEQITAVALSAFAEANIELAILETGLGGRFDATTAAKAEIVALTPIDLDHQQYLGDTLTVIAAEKAAIIREYTKVVVAPQKDEALQVILERCKEKSVVPLINACQVFEEDLPEVNFKTKNHFYPNIRLSLEGKHQRQNACTAINLAEILRDDFNFKISDAAIVKGLETADHKGRLEWKTVGETKFLFDGAHNIAGAEALKIYLKNYQSKITIIFGAMNDKDLSEITEILFPLADHLILTKPDNPRSTEVEELKKYAEKIVDKSKITLVPNVADAIDAAMQINSTHSNRKDAFVCITGSLYLVGEAQSLLKNQFGI